MRRRAATPSAATTTSTAASAGQSCRNGVRTGRLKTAEGFVDYAAPQIAGRDEPFRSEIRETLKGRTQALEDLAVELLARGLSVARHRGRVPPRDRSTVAVADCGVRDRRAAVGRRPGVRGPRSVGVRHRLSVRRRHCRAHPARPEARAGAGSLGLHGERRQGPVAPDGRLQRGRRDGERLLSGTCVGAASAIPCWWSRTGRRDAHADGRWS